MNFIKLILMILTIQFISCAAMPAKIPPTIKIESGGLREQIDRIEKDAAYCDGMPVQTGENSVTHRANCNSDDSMLWSGLLYNIRPSDALAAAIRDSISPEGRPYRSPENRRGVDVFNSFSRDMWLGFIAYCHRSKDFGTCDAVWHYVADHEHRTCPSDADEKCMLRPSTLYTTGHVWQSNGWHVPSDMKPSGAERALDEKFTISAANNNDVGYELHLISVRMYLYMETGSLTESYKSVLKILASRVPENLWYRYLEARAYGLPREPIEADLISRMSQWQKPGDNASNWEWQNHSGLPMGHDFIFLACHMLGGC